jgi:hypothetical protein
MLAVFDPTLHAVFWTLAIVAYIASAVSAARGRAVTAFSVGAIAVGLALWHFPELWDAWERAT